jgi:NAD(P)-dependent dehydrogenase (short-subunit alcohol dehydrogenase family)
MPNSEPARPMEGKVCLITGATAGIGLVTAGELARRGARVIGVGRSPERIDQAIQMIRRQTPDASVEYRLVDLSSQAEIRRLAQEVKSTTPRLDVLLNNAGGIFLARRETVDGLEMTFALNHLAYFLLTNQLLDLLRSTSHARIVSVSSDAHRGASINFDDLQAKTKYNFDDLQPPTRYRPWRAYQQSKLANILFTRELARRLEGSGVTANALHPGFVRTEIFRAEGATGWLVRRAADLFALSPERGAMTSLYLATSPEVEGVSGKYFDKQRPVTPSRVALNDESARRLWDVSAELTGLASHSA